MSTSHSNRRRFPRISTQFSDGDLHKILGAGIRWENGELLDVFDLGHGGLAVSAPKEIPKMDVIFDFELIFQGHQVSSCGVQAKTLWVNQNLMGLKFEPLSLASRAMLSGFLDDKIIGQNMFRVKPEYFSKSMDCQHWFHGPSETNLYLWEVAAEEGFSLVRAEMEFDKVFLSYDRGVVQVSSMGEQPLLQSTPGIVQRCMGVLGYIPDPPIVIKSFIEKLLNDV